MRPGFWNVEKFVSSTLSTLASGKFYFSGKLRAGRRSSVFIMANNNNSASIITYSGNSRSWFAVKCSFTTEPSNAFDADFHEEPECRVCNFLDSSNFSDFTALIAASNCSSL
jgi:hypothetical protein